MRPCHQQSVRSNESLLRPATRRSGITSLRHSGRTLKCGRNNPRYVCIRHSHMLVACLSSLFLLLPLCLSPLSFSLSLSLSISYFSTLFLFHSLKQCYRLRSLVAICSFAPKFFARNHHQSMNTLSSSLFLPPSLSLSVSLMFCE